MLFLRLSIPASALLLVATLSYSQPGMGKGSGGWGHRDPYQGQFNPKTMESFTGAILSLDTFSVSQAGRSGIHMNVARAKDTIPVHLGPQWFLENQDVTLAPNDTVTVKGSKITYNGKPAIIAAEVKKGKDVLVLRNAKGIPAWSGWRRGKS